MFKFSRNKSPKNNANEEGVTTIGNIIDKLAWAYVKEFAVYGTAAAVAFAGGLAIAKVRSEDVAREVVTVSCGILKTMGIQDPCEPSSPFADFIDNSTYNDPQLPGRELSPQDLVN